MHNSVNCTMWKDSSIIPILLCFGTFWLYGQIHEPLRTVRGNWLFTQTGRTCITTTGGLRFVLPESHAAAGCAVLTSTSARTSRKRLECLLTLSLNLNYKRSSRKWKFKFNSKTNAHCFSKMVSIWDSAPRKNSSFQHQNKNLIKGLTNFALNGWPYTLSKNNGKNLNSTILKQWLHWLKVWLT